MHKKWLLFGILLIWGCWIHPEFVQASPDFSTKYYCLIDRVTGQSILSSNANIPRPVASTTKMMTAILALEYAGPQEMAVVSPHADRTPEYTIGLRAGQQLPVGELVKVALIRSSNDAAVVLAEHVAGSERFFAYLMSKKAFLIGASNTHFTNASGLPDKQHYSTAYDLARIGRYALANPYISKMVASPEEKFRHPAYSQPLTIRNTNGMLRSYPGTNGIKTGTTDAAGKCLVASATRNKRSLIAVVLKSPDRQGDCSKLFEYGFKQIKQQKIINKKEVFKSIRINRGTKLYAQICPAEDIYLWTGEYLPRVEKKVKINYQLEAPVAAGYKVGVMNVYVNESYYKTVDLVVSQAIPKESISAKKVGRKLMGLLKGL